MRGPLDDLLHADRATLVDRLIEAFDTAPPPRLSRGVMMKVLASDAQWTASGRSHAALIAKLARIARTEPDKTPIAKPGARLVRDWNGRRHVVDVTDAGYLWNGRTWRSLSAIAREITGTKWSGPRFFGVAA